MNNPNKASVDDISAILEHNPTLVNLIGTRVIQDFEILSNMGFYFINAVLNKDSNNG